MNLKPLGIGFAVALLLAVVALLFWQKSGGPRGTRNDGYAADLTISGARVLAAPTNLGGSITYFDGVLHNRGDREVGTYTVELNFRDVTDRVVQRKTRELIPPGTPPLEPHQSRQFRIGFEKVSPDWNQAPPEVKPLAVYTQ